MVFGDVQGGEALMDVNFLSERREAAARNPMAKSVRKLKVPAIEKYQQLAGLKAIIGLYIYIYQVMRSLQDFALTLGISGAAPGEK